MYISLRSLHPVFRPLGRCAPVAVNSGLRPETHQLPPGKADSQKALNGPPLCFLVLLAEILVRRQSWRHGRICASWQYFWRRSLLQKSSKVSAPTENNYADTPLRSDLLGFVIASIKQERCSFSAVPISGSRSSSAWCNFTNT